MELSEEETILFFKQSIDFVTKEDLNGLKKHVAEQVRAFSFTRNESNENHYRKVFSHLEDGWISVSAYSHVRDTFKCDLENTSIGLIGNMIIRGLRENTVNKGDYPTRLDMAAFVYYLAFD